jgi:MFS family permease
MPRSAWLVLGGDALSALGTGLTLPFLVIYLNTGRGISLAASGAAVSTVALAGFVGNPLGGWLADRIGPRAAVVLGLLVSAAGAFSLAGVHVVWQAFLACAIEGLGAAIVWPAQDSLLAVVVEPEQRSSVFSVRHATMNAGLGIGGLVAAAIVRDGSSSFRFVLLYLIDGATFLAFIPILFALPMVGRAAAAVSEHPDDIPAVRRGVGVVLRDPAFRRVWLLTAGLVAVGYAQLNSAFPAYASRPGGIAPGAVGLAFAGNTVGVVGFQLVTLRMMAGRRRSLGVMLTGLFWAAAWAVTLIAGASGSGAMAVVVFALAGLVFAVGETFLSPSLAPIVNDLASDDLRGRYNGLYVLAWTTGYAVGPAVAGVLLDVGLEVGLFGGLIVACLLLSVAGRRLDRHLPETANMVGAL